MDENKKKALRLMAKRTVKNLEANNMAACFVPSREDALSLVKTLVPSSASTASGGSVTLEECGIMKYLREETAYIDRFEKGISKEELKKRDSMIHVCDYYLSSANAITEHGEIYQVDGTSNRISSLSYGPEKVIIVAGMNKLVPSLRSAVEKVKREAAPMNSIRLAKGSFCEKTGVCISPHFDEENLMCHADCGENTICCNTLIMKRQKIKDRVTVILVGEDLGY